MDQELECNKTILCGDIDRNGDSMNNSYHIVLTTNVSNKTVIDGFCIIGGNANGNGDAMNGGGWYNDGRGLGHSSNQSFVLHLRIINISSLNGGGNV